MHRTTVISTIAVPSPNYPIATIGKNGNPTNDPALREPAFTQNSGHAINCTDFEVHGFTIGGLPTPVLMTNEDDSQVTWFSGTAGTIHDGD